MTIDGARNFVTAIHDSIGKWPVLYGAHYLKDALSGAADPILSNCPLWLAQYGPNAVLPIGWDGWTLWQYTDGAVGSPPPVAGIGHCDQDRFSGDADGLPAFWASVSA
jgi:lysozyme